MNNDARKRSRTKRASTMDDIELFLDDKINCNENEEKISFCLVTYGNKRTLWMIIQLRKCMKVVGRVKEILRTLVQCNSTSS